MRSGFILLSVFVFSVSSAQYKGQNIRVDSLKANAMILQSGELPLGWPQDTLRVVIDTVNSIAPKVNKLYTGDDDEGGILPPSMVRDSIRYAIENAVGGGIPMPDTTEQGGKFLRYNGTEETPFDWAVAGSDSGNFAKLSGGNIFSGAQNATDFRASDSVSGASGTFSGLGSNSETTTLNSGKKALFWDRGSAFTSSTNGSFWFDTATTRFGDATFFNTTVLKTGGIGAGIGATRGFNFAIQPSRGQGTVHFHDAAFSGISNNDFSPFMMNLTPHQLVQISRFGPESTTQWYNVSDDIGALGVNMTTNSHQSVQPGQTKGIDVRQNIGGVHPWEVGKYTANGSYTPALAISGHFELNNYARSEIPTAYGVRARISNAHNNDSTRYGFAAGFKFSQPFWSYGGYDTLYGIHLDDPKYGDVRAAIGLRDTGLIAWKWDTFLKRTGAGNLNLDTNLTVTGTTATGNLRIENLGDGLLTTESGDVVVSAIVPNILPDTSGDAGKYLQYTGAGFDWVAETSVDSANFEKKNTIRQLFTSGLIDSVKTTDTLFLGAIYPAATVDTLRVDALGAVDVTMIVEMVDSLNQSSGQTPVCTTTVTNARKLISSFDEAALLNGKILRVRFTTVGTMPKQIIISVLGHR